MRNIGPTRWRSIEVEAASTVKKSKLDRSVASVHVGVGHRNDNRNDSEGRLTNRSDLTENAASPGQPFNESPGPRCATDMGMYKRSMNLDQAASSSK